MLCFLPGAPEIRALPDVRALGGAGVDVVPLHGSLPADEQDAALAADGRARVILATNIAETSLTVPGVTDVVDTGLHKVARYDAGPRDRLAGARAYPAGLGGAAGGARRPHRVRDARCGCGTSATGCGRMREPEIHRVDLADAVLDILAWGGDPATFEWFDAPSPERVDAALALLERLGAVRGTAA